ncbi:MAG: OadG family protein [Nitrospinae bacterium]|nr:OadG family protein [Nitrospinota bacterium]
MFDLIWASLIVTFISMIVIFIVLGVLYFLIVVLDRLLPHRAPAPEQKPAGGQNGRELTAVIGSAIQTYTGRKPGKLTITPRG